MRQILLVSAIGFSILFFNTSYAKADYMAFVSCPIEKKRVRVALLNEDRLNPIALALKLKVDIGCKPNIALKEYVTIGECKKDLPQKMREMFKLLLERKHWSINFMWCLVDPKSIEI